MEKEIGMLSILSKNKIVHMLAYNTKKNEPEDAVAMDNRKLVWFNSNKKVFHSRNEVKIHFTSGHKYYIL